MPNLLIQRIPLVPALLLLALAGCASTAPKPDADQATGDDRPIEAVLFSRRVEDLHLSRSWDVLQDPDFDPIAVGAKADIPVQSARAKIIGPFDGDNLRSLAAKIWMIENARHTIDVVYYIYTRDRVGSAVLGALCDAVQRGVDVRFLVDAVGSFQVTHTHLRALETCADDGARMREEDGEISPYRARMQVGVFNAVTSWRSRINRRSHDKLLVVDGRFPELGMVMTGGRNISLAYYGLKEDGTTDPDSYVDAEILLRPAVGEDDEDSPSAVGGIYYTLLFAHDGNRRVRAIRNPDGSINSTNTSEYQLILRRAREDLAFFKNNPDFRRTWSEMPGYMQSGYRSARVRMAHELSNLTNKGILSNVEENFKRNPNSINYLLEVIGNVDRDRGNVIRIISPYLLLPRYTGKDGEVLYDGAVEARRFLDQNPNVRIEIVTNSVLTSDNALAQSLIDMDMAPRLLMSGDIGDDWRKLDPKTEADVELVQSEDWQSIVSHPRIAIWQTGKTDSAKLGGDEHYGKLHAKFILSDDAGFIGTSNFDYRSRLLNNEFGYFFGGSRLHGDLLEVFERIKQRSLRWGSEEWLQMRAAVMEKKGMKGLSARKQRFLYRFMKFWNLEWLI